MYGLTRGVFTLIGAALSGFLVWLAFEVIDNARGDIDGPSLGEYWAFVGLLAAAGLTIALSQLLGGWTKWGWPRISAGVFMLAFVPVLIVVGWVVLANQPEEGWLGNDMQGWTEDMGLGGTLDDVSRFLPILAFGLGLVLGLTFDTTGRRTEPLLRRRVEEREPAPPVPPASHPLAAADVTEPAPAPPEEPSERPGARASGAGEAEPPPRRDEP